MISKVMSFSASPGLDFCTGIAQALNVPAEVVLRRAGLLPAKSEETETQREMRFLFDQLDEQAQATVIAMLRGYVRETTNLRPAKTTRAPA
jgi:transcriptional regulator with XRE-family HTH domain